jgi:hypothetical protein
MSLETIALILEDADCGIRGENIFVNMIPSEVVEGILLRQPFGGFMIDHELPGFRNTSFGLIVRSREYSSGLALIEKATNALSVTGETMWGTNMQVKFARPRHEPFVYPLSVGNLFEFITNIDLAYVIV